MARKWILASPGKSGKNRPKIGQIFPDFPGEAKIHFRAIFSDFGRKPETDFLPGRQDRKPKPPHTRPKYEQKYGRETVELPYFEACWAIFCPDFCSYFCLVGGEPGVTRASD